MKTLTTRLQKLEATSREAPETILLRSFVIGSKDRPMDVVSSAGMTWRRGDDETEPDFIARAQAEGLARSADRPLFFLARHDRSKDEART